MKILFLKYFFVLLVLISVGSVQVYARYPYSFNLGTEKGLPSNHVYGSIIDRYGYLWVCTDKGVVKYNGYECQLFNTDNGLPTDDIWELLEDKSGRIWLGCIASELGYIEDDRYTKVKSKDRRNTTIYPTHLQTYKDGVIFYSSSISGNQMPSLCVFSEDSLYTSVLVDSIYGIPDLLYNVPVIWIGKGGDVYSMYKETSFKLEHADSWLSPGKSISAIKKYKFNSDFVRSVFWKGNCYLVGRKVVAARLDKKSTSFLVIDPEVFRVDTLSLPDYGIYDPIDYLNLEKSYRRDDLIYVYTRSHILIFDVEGKPEHLFSISIDSVLGRRPEKVSIVSYLQDSLWETVFGTKANGLFVGDIHSPGLKFRNTGIDIQDCNFLGSSDSIMFWWDKSQKEVVLVQSEKIVKRIAVASDWFSGITEYNEDTMILYGSFNYWYDKRSRTTSVIPHWKLDIISTQVNVIGPDCFFSVTGRGIIKETPYVNADTVYNEYIDNEVYDGAAYDSLRCLFWIYNNDLLVSYDFLLNRIIAKISVRDLTGEKLDNVCVDGRYGNIFLKSGSSLMFYDPDINMVSRIDLNVNLRHAKMRIAGSMLIIAGDFGVLFLKIIGRGRVSEPVKCNNFKRGMYSDFTDISVFGRDVFLNTDKGFFVVSMPDDRIFLSDTNHKGEDQYKLYVRNHDKMVPLKGNDTIVVDQDERDLIFELIKPSGAGDTKFYASFDEKQLPELLRAGGVNLSSRYRPDNYYTLSLYALDDFWRSDLLKLNVYIKPLWWQTNTALRVIWISGILLSIGILVTAILVTRRIVLKSAERKQLQMEMELKSIYAQINPHFIFNTLNSALLLVSKNKMNEAYGHISKFSRLLRNYLKSSRNKYITLGEEADNLRNYIELQQARFKDRFDYELNVPDSMRQIQIPSLLIQPFVENAINHGILALKDERGNLLIKFEKRGQTVYCTIDDNGVGRKEAQRLKTESGERRTSYGDLMIRDLISIFNRYEGIRIDISYEDKTEPEHGTTVSIKILNKP